VLSRTAAADGTYAMEEMAPGSYHVRAFLAKSAVAVRRLSTALQGTPAPAPNVTLAPGEERTLDLDLTPIPVGSLRGTVRVNGRAAGGYHVQLTADALPGSSDRTWGVSHRKQVEPDGAFVFHDVEPGPYELRVSSIARDSVLLHTLRVHVGADEERMVAVDVAVASLTGTLRAPEDGRPVDGALALRPGNRAEPVPSERGPDSSPLLVRVRGGRFRADVLPAGSYVVEVRCPGRDSVRADLQLAAGEDRELPLTAGALQPAKPAEPAKSEPRRQ
jgi:hypothetical protein